MTKEKMSLYMGKETITIVEAMEMIDKNLSGLLFIVNEQNALVGCISDGDIRRWLLKTGELNAPVSLVMTKNPISITSGEVKSAEGLMRSRRIRAIPVIGTKYQVIDIILSSELTAGTINKKPSLADIPVVIMAGGKGTRLYPYTKILPKPLIPIGDTPIVERIMNYYTEYDIRKFYMTVNYKKGMLRSYFADGKFPFEIEYVEEDKPLGTGGSLKLIKETFDKPLFVTNCDALILTDYDKVYDYHMDNENMITMVAAIRNITIPYGVLHTKENNELAGMEEKPKLSLMVNTGMYVINPEVIEMIPDDTMFHMTHLIEKVKEAGQKVGVYPVSEDSFLDMGEFDEMRRMEEKLNIVME